MRSPHGRPPRLGRLQRVSLGAAALGLAAVTFGLRLAPAQAPPRTEESASKAVAQGVTGTCGEALSAGQQRFEEPRKSWAAESQAGRPVALGSAAEQAEKAALGAFDAVAGQSCEAQRKALQDAIRKDVLRIFQEQRVIAERQALSSLSRKLVKKMTQRGGPLRIQEKIDMLQAEVQTYKVSVKKLLPSWAGDLADPAEAVTERRLGELQFGIEETAEGQALARQWQDRRLRDLISRRAHGVQVSLDPALHVLIRPEGKGNLQVFSEGPLGPPSHPADMNLGIINDGSIADFYREHPVPPLVAVQPAVNVNLNVR